jgi:hypothetical protein
MRDFKNKMRDNKGFQFNGENNGTVNNNQVYNITIPKRLNDKEKQEKEKLTKRPCLKDKLGQKITCFGYIIGKHRYLNHLYTIINIVDITGEYVADHIQLDFKENDYDYTYDYKIGKYIRFTGIVTSYKRADGSIDYSIDIIKKVLVLSGEYDLLEQPYDYTINKIDIIKIDEYLSTQNITKIYDLIENMRQEINNLTNGIYFEDYLYYYIINQYTLNTSTYSVYQGELRDQNINEDCVIGILILIGSLLFELKTVEETDLFNIMKNISTECNVLQGIEKYTNYEENPNLNVFYQQYLSENKLPVGKKKLKKAFSFILNRLYDFNNKLPYDKDKIDADVIKHRAYHMIQKMI